MVENRKMNSKLLLRTFVTILFLFACFMQAIAAPEAAPLGSAPLSNLELKVSTVSPTAVGISVKLIAVPTGGISLEYMFKVKYSTPAGYIWQTVRNYAPTTYCFWTPAEAHDYTIIAYAREVGSKATYDLYRDRLLTVKPAVSMLNVFMYPSSPVEVGVPITFSPTAVGGGTLEYSYKVKYLSGGSYVWETLRGYTRDSHLTWTPMVAHDYLVYIYAREIGSAPNLTYSVFKQIPYVITAPAGPGPVNLGTAGNFAILAQSKITTTGTTAIVGNIGISPAALSYITGFSETLHGTYATSSLVTGQIFAANMTPPTPSNLTTAISDKDIAYTDAAGRTTPDHTELGAGDISGMTLYPGLYKWGTGVLMTTDVTLSGGPNSTWIFQISKDLTVASDAMIILKGGAQPKNIVWQVEGQTTLETGADFKGIILCNTQIVIKTGAVLTGRALAKTAVTLDANYITAPTADPMPLGNLQLKLSPKYLTAVGVPVKLTAVATGGKVLEYMFKVKYPTPAGFVWTTVRSYGPSPVCTWYPTEAHTYTVIAYVREMGLPTWVPYSLYRDQIITVNPAISGLNVVATPKSPVTAGVPITFSATAVNGGTKEFQAKVKYLSGSTYIWETIQTYSSNHRIVWTPTVARDYKVYIYARDVASGVPYAAYREFLYTITTP